MPLIYLPDFARGPQDAVNVPLYSSGQPVYPSTGLPVYLANVVARTVKSLTMTLDFNPALLNVTAAAVGPSASGWTITSTTFNNTLRQAVITASGSTALPATTSHAARRVVHAYVQRACFRDLWGVRPVDNPRVSLYSGSGLTGTAVPADAAAIHKVAYLGNASGNSSYGSLSASYIAQEIPHLISYFPAYPFTDPTIIAGDGAISSNNAVAVSQEAVHETVSSIPAFWTLPVAVSPITPVPGNDPLVRIAQNVSAARGGTTIVPVSITGPAGVRAIDLTFTYDTSRLQLTDSDVKLAGLTSKGWDLSVNVENGVAYVSAFSTTPLPASFSGSTFLDLNFQVPAKAPAGTAKIAVSASKGGGLNEGAMPMTIDNGSVVVASTARITAAAADAVLGQTSGPAVSAASLVESWLEATKSRNPGRRSKASMR